VSVSDVLLWTVSRSRPGSDPATASASPTRVHPSPTANIDGGGCLL